jgi:hypothetical protein
LLIAGHCRSLKSGTTPVPLYVQDDAGSKIPVTQPISGAPGYYKDAYNGDLMFVYASTPPANGFYFDGTGLTRSVTSVRTRLSTTAGNGTYKTAGTTTGSFVCHRGQEYQDSPNFIQSCGEVVSVNGNVAYDPDTNSAAFSGGKFVIIRNTQSGAGTVRTSGTGTLTCFAGDSGGPVFAGTVAFGIATNCAYDYTLGGPRYLMYVPADQAPVLIGVAVVVG